MKVTVPIGNLTFELEVKDDKDAIKKIGELQNVFTHTTCGCCGSTETRYVHSENDGYNFYEIRCVAKGCYARLKFGQKKEGGTLFPKLKDEDGNYKPHDGWEKWEGHKTEDEPQRGVPHSNNSQNWPAQQSNSLPPAPPFTILRQLLGDMGVTDNEARFQDAVIQFVTKEAGRKIGYPQCAKSSEDAQWAVGALQVAQIKHGDALIARVQEWMGVKR
jgi:hypothetical protein